MKCTNCSCELPQDATFCAQCGTQVTASAPASAPAPINWAALPVQARSFGSPYAEVVIPCNPSNVDELAEKIVQTFRMLGWGGSLCGKSIYGSASISFLSWGENISAQIYDDRICVRSVPAFSMTLVDWGINERNIRKFISYVSRL